MNTPGITKYLKKTRLRVSLPFVSYEVTLDDLLDSKDVDARVKRLSQIRTDLEETISAVEQLQAEALRNKDEADKLKETIEQLERDKSAFEEILKVPEDSFARILTRANSKSRVRGVVEGTVIGFSTGVLSSLLVWYLTTK